MGYHSIIYIFLFLPVCLLAYQLAPEKWRGRVLLAFSWIFFYLLSGKLLVYLLGTTLLTHCIGIWLTLLKTEEAKAVEGMDRKQKKVIKVEYQKKGRRVLILGILILLGVLGYLKYFDFFTTNLSYLFGHPVLEGWRPEKLLMPIGISFYTLQAIGYMTDVYWGTIQAETEIWRTALFLGFFPQIMEGPIARYSDVADTLYTGKPLEYRNVVDGYVRIFWGLFKKMVIADRMALMVNQVFDHYADYHGAVILAAAIGYVIQLYMEFSGCMDIIIGSGKLFGICLPENFRQPFCAKNPSEFWRRWHITLGAWFKAYIFYPVSVSGLVKKWNQYGRKHCGKHITRLVTSAIALFPVWVANGVWHGAQWNYIFYGMYYFVLIMLGIAVEPVRDHILEACHIDPETKIWRTIQIAKTWVIIVVGELFFRANGLKAGWYMFCSMIKNFDMGQLTDGTLYTLGLERADYLAVIVGCLIVGVIGSMKERGISVQKKMGELAVPVRWGLYYALVIGILTASFDEFSSLLLREGVTVKESRGRLSYLTPDRINMESYTMDSQECQSSELQTRT